MQVSFASFTIFKNRASTLNMISTLLREYVECCAANEGGCSHFCVITLSSLQTPFTRGPPCQSCLVHPPYSLWYSQRTHQYLLSGVPITCRLFTRQWIYKVRFWRLLLRLQQAGLILLAMTKAWDFPRAESCSQAQPAHLPGLCSCSWSLALHIPSLQREEILPLNKTDIDANTVWLSFTHSSIR